VLFRSTVAHAVGADPQAGKLAAPRGESLSRSNPLAIPGVDGPHGAHGGAAASGRPVVEHAATRRRQGAFGKTPWRRSEAGLRRGYADAILARRGRLCPGARRPFRANSARYPTRGTVGPERYLPAAAPGRHGEAFGSLSRQTRKTDRE